MKNADVLREFERLRRRMDEIDLVLGRVEHHLAVMNERVLDLVNDDGLDDDRDDDDHDNDEEG